MSADNEFGSIEIRCTPDNRNVLAGVMNTKRVRFDVETKGKGETKKRTPLNLVLVLDRSGSMESNQKLVFAKKAVVSVLNLLHDDDIVHLVAYDTDVSIIFENARASTRNHLYPLVNEIETAGSTNMSGAITVGADVLKKHAYEGFSNRMFLFSDGQANVGMRTSDELTKLVAHYNNQGITTDSFGIGADFDSVIMKGIADAGGSRFYFLSSPEMIEVVVTKALVCVFGVCASRVRLLVRGKNGAIVTKIWGHENIVAGAALGDLHTNNLRSVLCEFTVAGSANTEIETLAYELQYNHPADPNGETTAIKDTLSLKFVEDESLITHIDPRVKTMYATQMASELDKKIAQLVKENRRTDALILVDEQVSMLKEVEKLDDERGTIGLLLRLAEHMAKKLKDETIETKLVARGYEHQAFLKEECDDEEMGFGLFD